MEFMKMNLRHVSNKIHVLHYKKELKAFLIKIQKKVQKEIYNKFKT